MPPCLNINYQPLASDWAEPEPSIVFNMYTVIENVVYQEIFQNMGNWVYMYSIYFTFEHKHSQWSIVNICLFNCSWTCSFICSCNCSYTCSLKCSCTCSCERALGCSLIKLMYSVQCTRTAPIHFHVLFNISTQMLIRWKKGKKCCFATWRCWKNHDALTLTRWQTTDACPPLSDLNFTFCKVYFWNK